MFKTIKAKLKYYGGNVVEYKIGDRIKFLPFLDICRMGKVKYGFGVEETVVIFPNKKNYVMSDLKRIGGVQGKVIEITKDDIGILYTVQWCEGKTELTFLARPFLIGGTMLSIVKCEVEEIDTLRIKFKAKEKLRLERKVANDRIIKTLNMRSKK